MNTPLPEEFPALPPHFDSNVWPPNVVEAHSILNSTYQYALEALYASDNDGHRLQLHSEKIQTRLLPILEAMEPEVLNPEWLKASAEALAGLVLELEVAASQGGINYRKSDIQSKSFFNQDLDPPPPPTLPPI
ncbi:hypothetical protein B0H19DRAFT_1274705 [Mycena capillaripes]|nr:hypothetical protein B0H19DRAFT_1274705 [Mycena capillaripes]